MPPLQFNPGQQRAIDVRINAIVAAGAGSGKTSVLSERFASLLEKDKLALDSILCLTFTRKAAAEMYERIHTRLVQSLDPNVQQRMESFDEARILTLDAFCGSIARSGSRHYGIAPGFTTDETRLAEIIDRSALALIMRNRQHPLIRRLVAHLDFDRVRRDLLSTLALSAIPICRDDSFGELAQKHCKLLENQLKQTLDGMADLIAAIFDMDPGSHKKIGDLHVFLKNQEMLEDIPSPQDRSTWSTRLYAMSKDKVLHKRGNHGIDEELDLLKKCFENASDILSSLSEEESIRQAGELLDEFARDLDEAKRMEGVLSFNDVALLARRVLMDNRDIRNWYKEQLSAIMIDEFQDNNSIQKDLLFLIAERKDRYTPGIPTAKDIDPRKLFFVGDEKQSIYRFRGADVSVFRLLSDELDQSGSSPTLPLGINYRSEPELISFFNDIFPGIFGPAHNPWEARFDPLSSPSGRVPNPEKTCVSIHLFTKGNEDEADTDEPSAGNILNEAVHTALHIASAVKDGRYSYRDFSILFRSTSEQSIFERTLGDFGIPWTTPEPRGVFLEALANDFHAILRLIPWPEDRQSYAAVLRSPFAMLCDPTVFTILESNTPAFSALFDAVIIEDDKERSRWEHAVSFFSLLNEHAKHDGNAALISFLWYEGPYRHSVLASDEYQQLEAQFLLLHEQAAAADARGLPLSGYLDELSALIGTSEKLKSDADASPNTDAVTFLTIHKSKGLEFPVVIIPCCGSKGKTITNEKPWYLHKEVGPVINLPAEDSARNTKTGTWLFNEAKEREQAMALAELCRLFYVACTRAEKELHIVGTAKLSKKDREELDPDLTEYEYLLAHLKYSRKDREKTRSFIELLSLGISDTFPAHTRLVPIPDRSRQEIARLKRQNNGLNAGGLQKTLAVMDDFHTAPLFPKAKPGILRRSPSLLEGNLATRSSTSGKKDKLEGIALPVDTILDTGARHALFGTLCHRIIEEALNKRLFNSRELTERIFAKENVLSDVINILALGAEAFANNFLDSPLGQKAMASTRMQSEFAFILPLSASNGPDILFQGSMDLVFEYDGECIIIDFKTDRHQQAEQHAVQLAVYARAAPAFSKLPVKTAVAYLRTGSILEIDHNQVSAERIISLAHETREQHA